MAACRAISAAPSTPSHRTSPQDTLLDGDKSLVDCGITGDTTLRLGVTGEAACFSGPPISLKVRTYGGKTFTVGITMVRALRSVGSSRVLSRRRYPLSAFGILLSPAAIARNEARAERCGSVRTSILA